MIRYMILGVCAALLLLLAGATSAGATPALQPTEGTYSQPTTGAPAAQPAATGLTEAQARAWLLETRNAVPGAGAKNLTVTGVQMLTYQQARQALGPRIFIAGMAPTHRLVLLKFTGQLSVVNVREGVDRKTWGFVLLDRETGNRLISGLQ